MKINLQRRLERSEKNARVTREIHRDFLWQILPNIDVEILHTRNASQIEFVFFFFYSSSSIKVLIIYYPTDAYVSIFNLLLILKEIKLLIGSLSLSFSRMITFVLEKLKWVRKNLQEADRSFFDYPLDAFLFPTLRL